MNSSEQRPSPWHAGETQMQAQVGVAERMAEMGKRVIRDYMPEQHREFYEHLPYVIIGAVDGQGWPWASLLDGKAGFINSPDPRQLHIGRLPNADDPMGEQFQSGSAVGLLGIDLHTRRRNRMNGRITELDDQGFSVEVEHSYGNCPQYIQLRALRQISLPVPLESRPIERLQALDEAAVAMIRGADTFFVASYVDLEGDSQKRNVDVSHRREPALQYVGKLPAQSEGWLVVHRLCLR
jgi:predicted pyridoxine 5'-phosphate oxidase superfamily flavin-nucleotide-binding protein